MGSVLPDLVREEFANRLQACAPEVLTPDTTATLWLHYQELRRWNPRLSLIGPGTASRVVERHYGEALSALPLLEGASSLLDVGTGGGFPGLVLAAARPELAVILVEARERKWAFLQSAVRRARLSCQCLNARVGAALELPPVDLVVWRALRLPEAALVSLAGRSERMLVWCGAEGPSPPPGWQPGRQVFLAESEERRIVEWTPARKGERDS
jgi:16S rRNA (guanine(527)-N(7))-methyltransferase RsmG